MRFLARLTINPIRPAARPPLAAACLVLYLVAWIGVPMPAPATPVAADGSAAEEDAEPFPCQDHHCGCANARQCWEHCCCMTMAERRAWARTNHVQPPDWVMKLVANAVKPAERTAAKESCGCCCHESKGTGAIAACAAATPAKPLGKSPSSRWVNLIESQRCNGGAMIWVASGAVLTPVLPVQVEQDLSVGDAPAPFVLNPSVVVQLPDVPPPRG